MLGHLRQIQLIYIAPININVAYITHFIYNQRLTILLFAITMITVEQIRAARAMLNWSQRQLAQASGISFRNIQNIEANLVTPRLATIKAIKNALENSRIVFAEDCGVFLQKEEFSVSKLEGESAIEALTNDMIACLRLGEKEVLLCNVNEQLWIRNMSQSVGELYRKELLAANARERCLTAYGDMVYMNDPEFYRWIQPEYFSETCYVVCGTMLAIILWNPTPRIIRVRNREIANSYRRQFDHMWSTSEIPPQTQLIQADNLRAQKLQKSA